MIPWFIGWLAAGISLSAAPDSTRRPVAIWAAGPFEVRLAFDRPLDPAVAKGFVGQPINFGDPMRPPLGKIRIAAARLVDDGRTLVLTTDPHPREAVYSVPAGYGSYGLTGVEVAWDDGSADARPAWSGWWPSLDPDVTRKETKGSVEHEQGLARLAKPGRLTLHTLVALPKGRVTLRLVAENLIDVALNYAPGEIKEGRQTELTVESTGEALDLTATVRTGLGGKPTHLAATFKIDGAERPLTRDRLVLPWSPIPPTAPSTPPIFPAEMAGGDPKRGEAVFYGDQAKCSQCHKIRGKGGEVGPDLSDLWKRDRAEVYRDVAEPSAVIDPDYVPYTIALKDGQVLSGTVRAEGADAIRVIDTEAKATIVPRAEIEALHASATSIMPVGLVGAIGEANMRDLLAFLAAKPMP